ncbi:MAG: ComF family protein, partial [Deltaproteobacteria bacterium]|nr:ComF family protein [Deltaproteobacteria bacterium]
HKNVVKGEKVILVDDVATTGNTLNECARVLLNAGCREVCALVLARTGGY